MLAMVVCVLSKPTQPYHRDSPQGVGASGTNTTTSGLGIRYHNSARFDPGRNAAATQLLDPADSAAHIAWRELYAEQLYAWGLHEARLEVLTAGGGGAFGRSRAEETVVGELVGGDEEGEGEEEEEWRGECGICHRALGGDVKGCSHCGSECHAVCWEHWAHEELYQGYEVACHNLLCPWSAPDALRASGR